MRYDQGQFERTDTNPHATETGTQLRLVPAGATKPERGQLLGGRYRLRKWIANGGMSEVWCAHDEKLGRDVAAKIAKSRTGLLGVELLEHEAQLLTGLNHPGIVTAYDVGRHGELGYLVMPLLRGMPISTVLDRLRIRRGHNPNGRCIRNLQDALGGKGRKRQPLVGDDWYRTVVRIMVELLRAVEAAHFGNVLHRDLKPANVVLTADGHPVLVDFGLGGRVDTPGPDADRLTGTPAFFAPEQIRNGRAGTDVRTEVYQLGLLLHEFLTLEPVFPTSARDVTIRIELGECARPRSIDPLIPRALEAVCLKARALRPNERYQSVAALRTDLVCFLRAESVSAIPSHWLGSGLSRLGRWVRRREVVGG